MIRRLSDRKPTEQHGMLVEALLQEGTGGGCTGVVVSGNEITDFLARIAHTAPFSIDTYLCAEWRVLRESPPTRLKELLLAIPAHLGPAPWLVCASPSDDRRLHPFVARSPAGLIDAVLLTTTRLLWPGNLKLTDLRVEIAVLELEHGVELQDPYPWRAEGTGLLQTIFAPFVASGGAAITGDPSFGTRARFRFGLEYNRIIKPHDPFEFLDAAASAASAANTRLCRLFKPAVEATAEEAGGIAVISPLVVSPHTAGLAERARQLVGIPVSPGVVEGTLVRTLPTANQIKPLMLLAAGWGNTAEEQAHRIDGLILTNGGRMGYPAFRARALGIPCVTDVPDCHLIRDGDRVSLDGTTGIIIVGREANN